MSELVHEDEVLDDLQRDSLMLIQKRKGFKFGMDAVLLADFAKDAPSERTIDLCTGTGIVAVLLSAKTDAPEIRGLEIQHEICDMARRSVLYNGIGDRVYIDEGDVKDAARLYGKGSFDKVTVNPPYIRSDNSLRSPLGAKAVSRHEILCTLKDVTDAAGALLRTGGKFFMVHRPSRLADIICCMRGARIEPKRMRMVQPSADKAPSLILIEGTKNGGNELKLMEPLCVFNGDGSFSAELDEIYGRG